jgi:hypothetical protein
VASATPLNRFLAAFVLPLVAGGHVQVRGLIGPGMLARFAADRQMDGSLVAEITKHARAHLARIGPVGPVDLLPTDAIALAAVWHNLVAMTHPESVNRTRLRRRVRAWCLRMLEWVGPPRTAADVANRHGVLARLGELGRVDTDVAFWAGSARYVGVAPPGRLLAWRNLRRVRETKTRVPFFDLLKALDAPEPDASLLEPAATALALSPLTDVALAERPEEAAFHWTSASVNAAGDHALRGAPVRLVLARAGSEARANEPPPPRLRVVEAATRQLATQEVPRAAAAVLTRLHLEMLVADALGRGGAPPGHALGWDALLRLGVPRAAAVVGLTPARVERALALDLSPREPVKDAPAAALLARAGLLEEAS